MDYLAFIKSDMSVSESANLLGNDNSCFHVDRNYSIKLNCLHLL